VKIEEYESVKKWFAWKQPKPYTDKTNKLHVGYMKIFCVLTNKTPDELVSVKTLEAGNDLRGIIASGMRHKRKLGTTSIEVRVNAFNEFFRANGVSVGDPYGGVEKHDPDLIKDIRRLVKKSG
jgi:hypothetical protein